MTRKYNIKELEKFLRDNDIPKIKTNPKTFLGIAKQPHYENVLSNIYAFFFDPNEEHGLKDLFIKSFVNLINKQFVIQFELFTDFEVYTEYSTEKGGRIDLLLQNEEKVIIIENKVYHHLDNDLDDYWNSIKLKTKKGVVLSLKKIYHILPISHSNNKPYPNPYPFINITHLEFLEEVMKNSGDYLLNANDKYIVFLKDLYQNIINLSNQMETKDINFFFNNIEKINNLLSLKAGVLENIKLKIDSACEMLGSSVQLVVPSGGEGKFLRYFVSTNNSDLMFTVVFFELLEKKELFIAVEAQHNAKDLIKENIQEYLSLDDKLVENDKLKNNDYWAHLYNKTYTLNNIQIENLGDFIAEEIQNKHFLSIFSKVDIFLSKKKKNDQVSKN